MNGVQSASLLLKYCHVPRLNYLARVVPPKLLTSAAEIHDLQKRKVFSELLSYHQLSELAWQQATLPVRLGGFGLISVKSIAACAFLASWFEAIDALPKRFPDLRVDLDLLLKGSSGSATGATLNSLIPSNELSENKPASGKLQKRLPNDLFESMSRDTVKSTRDAARIRSLHDAGAGAWVNAIPTSICFALDSCVYRLTSHLRLGLPVCCLEWLSSCQCGAVLDDRGYNL